MIKKRFISMLVLLITAATGAWAQTGLETPLTLEALTAGTIKVDNPKEGMQYSLDNGLTKTTMTANPTTIAVAAGDKVALFGKGTTINNYDGTKILGTGTGFKLKVQGNIMSLVDEEGFATNKTLTTAKVFFTLFKGNTSLTDAGGLLLPATTLTDRCYASLFEGCANLTAAPALPATTLAVICYRSMFSGCISLTTAPVLPAETLTNYCYQSMFNGCTNLNEVTCLATNISATGCTSEWLNSVAATGTFTKAPDATIWTEGISGIPTGWTAKNYPTYKVSVKEGTEDATSWTIAPAEATTTGVEAGTEVKATYSGMKKVKSVKAKKKAAPAATVTTAPTAKTGVKAGEDVAIVNEGTAEGGTMMYMVNATQPASTDGFSATVPTAEGLTAGTYYVWYYVKTDDSHTDSEISASGIEVTIAAAVEPTLANTLNNAGMTVKVNFNYRWDVCYCLFTSNGNGTYTFQSGDEDFGGNLSRSRDLVVEDGKLVFKANWYSPITNYWDTDGYSVTFDTSNSTYSEWVGGDNMDEPSFISVEVNGTTISLSKASKITVDDLVKEEMQSWEDIVSNNSDKIYIDDGNIKRLSDGAKLLKYSVGDIWEDVNSWDNYDPNTTYKFAGD